MKGTDTDFAPLLALFDASHRHSYELLESAWASGGRDAVAAESREQASYHCPFPTFVYVVEHPDRFSLTSSRDLYRALRLRGYLSLAADILERVASATGQPSDREAALRFREKHQSTIGLIESPEPTKTDEGSTRAGTVLILDYDVVEATSLAADLAGEGYAPEVLHVTDSKTTKSRWYEGVRVHTLSLSHADGAPENLGAKLETALTDVLRHSRPALIHAALEPAHATIVSRIARREGVTFVWDYHPDESWKARQHIAIAGALVCPVHLPESPAPTTDEIRSALNASVTWTRTEHAAERLRRVVGDVARVKLHPHVDSIRDRSPNDSAALYVEAADTPVLQLVDALLPVLELRAGLGVDKVTLVGAGEDKGRRVARGLPKSVSVDVAAAWNRVQLDSASVSNCAAIFPVYPSKAKLQAQSNSVARARALGLSAILATDVTIGPYLQPSDSLRYYNAEQPRSLAQQLEGVLRRRVLRHDGAPSLGRSLTRHYSEQGVLSRVSPRKTRRSDPHDFKVTDAELRLWTEWVRENNSQHGADWFSVRGQTGTQVIEQGWRFAEFPLIRLGPDTNWHEAANSDRSWGFHLHAWEFMDPVIQEFRRTGDARFLKWCLEVAAGWYRQMSTSRSAGTMAWYDMALALRSSRLAGLIHLSVSVGEEFVLEELFSLALMHQDAHVADEAFNPENNHGFYAALGQSILARELIVLPGMQGLLVQGKDRMRRVASRQFLADGGHAEHSPDYHRMLLESFRKAIEQQVITDPVVTDRMQRASYVLGWLVQPQGTLLQFGDSPATPMVRPDAYSLDPQARYILTDGREGRPDDKELLVLPETGYAVVRTPQPKKSGDLKRGSYLAMMAAFHSRAHKQCDDLSLVWVHEGTEILVDGGRYGYGEQLPEKSPLRTMGFYYADPMRQFVESVWAHNTVSIDEMNPDRRRPPYGSGLIEASERDGAFYLVADSPHIGWNHRREVHFSPGRVLRITDSIDVTDDELHSYSVHFNINGRLSLHQKRGRSIEIGLGEKRVVHLEPHTSEGGLEVLRAQDSPLRGWRSVSDRRAIPSWFVSYTGTFRGRHTHTSTFILN